MSLNDLSLKSNVLGRDGAHTFIAKVVPAEHWKPKNDLLMITGLPSARCKIRVVGDDPPSKTELPDEDCRWALIASPPGVGGGSGGRGETISYVGGEMVGGYYTDGSDRQQPIITHTFPSSEEKVLNNESENAYDVPQIKPGENTGVVDYSANAYNDTKDAKKSVGTPTQGGGGNKGADALETAATNDISSYSKCGDDTISKTKNLVYDLMQRVQSFEEVGGNLIDPLTNEIVNMQYDIQVLQEQVVGIMAGSVNLIRKKIVKEINKEIQKQIKKKKTEKGPGKDGNGDNSDETTKKGLLGLIACVFKDVFSGLGSFIGNMFTNLLNNVLNGALCAVEQFISGIFAKIFDGIESALSAIMSGLSWLTGGFAKISGLLRQAGSFAKNIFEFLDRCSSDSEACKAQRIKKWSSSSNSSTEEKKDNWGDTLKNVNIFRGISKGLGNIQEDLAKSGEDVSDLDYNGVPISQTIKATSLLTGGSSNALLNKGLGSIESAISQSSLFGLGNNTFSACNNTVDNPNSQDDLTPTIPGYIYPKCIPPVVKVSGSGSGAELFAIVGNDRRIFSIEVINGGSGYDNATGLTVVDNTGNGVGAFARPIVKNGSITQVVLMKTGYGYCLNTTDDVSPVGIGTNVLGTVEGVFVEQPGYNHDSDDTITIGNDTFPILTSPNGALVSVTIPIGYNSEFDTFPSITVNTENGFASKLIPIMSFKGQLKSDVNADKRKATPLIGIDHVVDCIGDNRDPVGYVNGAEYSGPYHVMSSGVKMTGATHSGSDSIIYDTIQESISDPVVSSSSYGTPTETVTEISTETTTVDTTPTIVTTPTTPTMDTTTSTDTSTSTGTDTSSSGGGGYGGY